MFHIDDAEITIYLEDAVNEFRLTKETTENFIEECCSNHLSDKVIIEMVANKMKLNNLELEVVDGCGRIYIINNFCFFNTKLSKDAKNEGFIKFSDVAFDTDIDERYFGLLLLADNKDFKIRKIKLYSTKMNITRIDYRLLDKGNSNHKNIVTNVLKIDTGKKLFDELCSELGSSNFFRLLEKKFKFNSIQLETRSMSPFTINEFDFTDANVRDYCGGTIIIDNVNSNTDTAKRINLIKLNTEDGSKINGSIVYADNTEEKVYVY